MEEAPPELNSSSQGDPGPGTRDRLRWALTPVLPAVLALGLLVAGAGAGYLAYENDSRADKWRERADRLQRNADQLNELLIERTEVLNKRPEELNALAAKLKKAQRAIARSEEDVKTLERRQRQLANRRSRRLSRQPRPLAPGSRPSPRATRSRPSRYGRADVLPPSRHPVRTYQGEAGKPTGTSIGAAFSEWTQRRVCAHKNSPSRFRFRPPYRVKFRFRVLPPGAAST